MDARPMVFDVGDRITGSGELVADADGEWLDLVRVHTLEWPARLRPHSSRSVRLVGAGFDALRAGFGPDNPRPGAATVSGIWLGDAIEVQALSTAAPTPVAVPSWRTPPCPPPAGGWPRGQRHHNLDFDLGDLRSSGAAVAVVQFSPSADQAVLVVAASDVDAVERVLRPQLPDRLCVVPCRWTRAQLDDVRAHFFVHLDDWGVLTLGEHIDEYAQPSIVVELVRVTATLADWADTLPDGLLKLVPSLIPLP